MMSNDLFVRLSKYAPRAGKSAIENFFTELVGHLLAQEDAARQEFLGFSRAISPIVSAMHRSQRNIPRRAGTLTLPTCAPT